MDQDKSSADDPKPRVRRVLPAVGWSMFLGGGVANVVIAASDLRGKLGPIEAVVDVVQLAGLVCLIATVGRSFFARRLGKRINTQTGLPVDSKISGGEG